MGRLHGTRARVLLTVALVVAVPFGALATSRMTLASGAPGISLTLALVVAHLLSVGPRGAPLAWGAFAVHGLVVGQQDPSLGLAVVALVQAALTVGCVRVVESRFAHHGPVRNPLVVLEFAALAATLLPLLVAGTVDLLTPALGLDAWPGPMLQRALAEGIGVLAVTAGVRMLVLGERIDVDDTAVGGIVAATAVSVAAVLVTLEVGGIETLASAQVVLLPVLLVALLAGTAAYAIAMALTSIGILVPVAIAGTAGDWPVDTSTHVVWWIVAFAGLLLATDGDRRRATAIEFRTFFTRSATPTVSVSTADGKVTRANEAVAALLGSRVDDLVGRPIVRLVADQPEVAAQLERVVRGETSELSAELPMRPSPDRELWVRCVATHVHLGGPQHDVVQVQFVDLTAERERQGSLERSNAALARFGRRVTHDLKQPLSAVAAYASTLAEHAQDLDPAVVRTMYGRLESVARRASMQLDETFAASHATGSEPTSVSLHEVVASVVGVIDIDLAESGGAVDTALSSARVRAEQSMVRQVLLNLLTNSLKYARDDVPVRVRIASRVRGAGVEVTVTDNGTGIPADQLEAVFDRGRRLAPDRADGRGHGLADSRELAEAAGGWLVAEPWPDGARFVLWLPDPGVTGAGPASRVLLVDDEHDELTVLRTRLELQAGIEVVGTATTIEEAVVATRELRPDVILLDRWLRGRDGLQGLVELARAHPDVRIVLLTSDVTADLDQQARAEGVLRALDKAVSDDDLVAQLVGGGAR